MHWGQSLALGPLNVIGEALTNAPDAASGALRSLQCGPIGEGVESRPEAHSPEPDPEWNIESQSTHSGRHRDRHALLHGCENRGVRDEVAQQRYPIDKMERSPRVPER